MKEKALIALKIALASMGAIIFAEIFSLQFSVSAGIVAILTVAPTKQETFKTASKRFIAFIVALALSFVCFSLLSFGLDGFFLYLFVFLLLCQWSGWESAMAMNSVLISHFITLGKMDISALANETMLFFFGTSFGILANLHLHENIHFMRQMEEETDEQMKMILTRMAQQIKTGKVEEDTGECFVKIRDSLQKAEDIARVNFMNQMKKKDSWDMNYIVMREKQTFILYNIHKKTLKLEIAPLSAEYISDFIQFLSHHYSPHSSTRNAEVELEALHHWLDVTPLPVTREEFEARAELYGILEDVKEFMCLKQEFIEKSNKEESKQKK